MAAKKTVKAAKPVFLYREYGKEVSVQEVEAPDMATALAKIAPTVNKDAKSFAIWRK